MEEILLGHVSARFQAYVLKRQLQTKEFQLQTVKLWKDTLGGVAHVLDVLFSECDSEQ